LSHCGNMVMCITLWRWTNVCHIATIWLWLAMVSHGQQLSNMVNYCQLWSTTTNHGHGQLRSTIVMFVTLWQYGYLCHIVCLSYKAMFVTLWQYGYVRHIVIMWLWQVMLMALQQYGYVRHNATIWLWQLMFVTLRNMVMSIKLWNSTQCLSNWKTQHYVHHIVTTNRLMSYSYYNSIDNKSYGSL